MAVSLLLVVLLAACFAGATDWSDCPASCHCKWSSGKKQAKCVNVGLTAVPSSLNSDIQVLDLSGNQIPYLTRDAFRSVGLVNLQKIFLRGAGVREVHRDAFRDLRILIEVDLSSNAVSSLHPDTFTGNDRLRLLCLNGNPIVELNEAQFPALQHLRTLELQNCLIKDVHKDAFLHLTTLETLNLNGNRLRELSEEVFVPTKRLKTLSLDGNPWRCDCRLRGFRTWLLASNLYSSPLKCEQPEAVAGRPWQDVPPKDFACAPEVTLSDRMLQVEVGGNVTFHCLVDGDPDPTVAWLFNGLPLGAGNASNPEAIFTIEEEETAAGRWTNLSVYNVTEADAGEYACVATNVRGIASRNATLLLPQVVSATTQSKADGWLLWAGVAAGGGVALGAALLALACSVCAACRPHNHHRRRHKRRKCRAGGGVKGSVSFTEQEKKLLDASITTTERPSCSEGLGGSQPDMELLEQQLPPLEVVPPPVHITIESHASLLGADAQCAASGGGAYPGALTVFPPPPEFSTSVLPAGAFGNIFISVSVSQQDPDGCAAAAQRYPDLLDIPHRSKAPSVSVAAGPDAPFYMADSGGVTSYATLPRNRAVRKDDVPIGK